MSAPAASERLDLIEAIQQLEGRVDPVPDVELVTIAEAQGRVLAEPAVAPVSLPPFAASAMDGYAYGSGSCSAQRPLRIVGVAAAGHPLSDPVPAQCCVRIMTGAALPPATDTVVIQENVTHDGTEIRIETQPDPGANVRQPGHDISVGQQLLPDRRRLTAFDIGLLNAAGIAQLKVRRRVRLALFSSGDELIAPGSPLAAGQIYDSNRALLRSLLHAEPVTITTEDWLPDDPTHIEQALNACSNADLILSSGGVSVGDTDHLGRLLKANGELGFWRLNLKPGKPVAFGRFGSAWMLGLPGNPVSTAITGLLLAQPLIRALAGAMPSRPRAFPVQLKSEIQRKPGREEYQRGQLIAQQDGTLEVQPTGDQSSNRLSTFTAADCLLRLEKDRGSYRAGEWVEVLPLQGLVGS
ncbi:MAG: gephyrin-like molybdotransferase Glp [Pseudomonadota bacterium]